MYTHNKNDEVVILGITFIWDEVTKTAIKWVLATWIGGLLVWAVLASSFLGRGDSMETLLIIIIGLLVLMVIPLWAILKELNDLHTTIPTNLVRFLKIELRGTYAGRCMAKEGEDDISLD